eukprot:923756-Prymnesium_polylepis.1
MLVGDDCGNIALYDVQEKGHEGGSSLSASSYRLTRDKRHTDWVTKVHKYPDLNFMISSSLDGTLKLGELERGRKATRTFGETDKHAAKKGVRNLFSERHTYAHGTMAAWPQRQKYTHGTMAAWQHWLFAPLTRILRPRCTTSHGPARSKSSPVAASSERCRSGVRTHTSRSRSQYCKATMLRCCMLPSTTKASSCSHAPPTSRSRFGICGTTSASKRFTTRATTGPRIRSRRWRSTRTTRA